MDRQRTADPNFLSDRVIHVSGVPPPTITLRSDRVIHVSGVPPPTITLRSDRVIHVSGVPPPTITLYRSAVPVLPNPPCPRSVWSSAPTSSHAARVTGASTAWAIRAPRSTTNGSVPAFRTITWISPR